MGGAAGHLQNAWEATDLTFGDIRELIHLSVSNKLELYEKLDGQNLMLTWKNDCVYMGRTGKHLRDYGALGIAVVDVLGFFSPSTPDTVRKAYHIATMNFQILFSENKDYFDEIFQEGKVWLNAEILYEDTENIIHYGLNQIRIHNLISVDENGKTIEIIETPQKLLKLSKELKTLSFDILPTNKVSIKLFNQRLTVEAKLHAILTKIQISKGLNDEDTLSDYMILSTEEYIFKTMPNQKEFWYLIEPFGKRWALGDKSINIAKLLNAATPEVDEWFRLEDKKGDIKKDVLFPLVTFFLQLAVVILKNVNGLVVKDYDKSVELIKEKANESIDYISDTSNNIPAKDIKRLLSSLEQLKLIGKSTSIVPTEGVVFNFKGHLLKLTGAFSPLIQLIGYTKYKK